MMTVSIPEDSVSLDCSLSSGFLHFFPASLAGDTLSLRKGGIEVLFIDENLIVISLSYCY